jgi:hypothetical protein
MYKVLSDKSVAGAPANCNEQYQGGAPQIPRRSDDFFRNKIKPKIYAGYSQ